MSEIFDTFDITNSFESSDIDIRNFVAIDFETANPKRTSACSLGIAVFEDLKLVSSEHYFIKPYPFEFAPYNVAIHGITEETVANAPTFDELWASIEPKLEGKLIIAHNASFDISVLRRVAEAYEIPLPEIHFLCTYRLAEQVFPGLCSYSLDTLAETLNIELNHHNATSDAIACGELMCHIVSQNIINNSKMLTEKFNISFGCLNGLDYAPCGRSKHTVMTRYDKNEDRLISLLEDIGTVLNGKTVVFKGTTSLFDFDSYKLMCEKAGGKATAIFYSSADYLVFGSHTYNKYKRGDYSAKMLKAIALEEAGTLKILSELDFLRLLGYSVPHETKVHSRSHHIDIKSMKAQTDDFNESHPLFGKTCVFTGAMDTLIRADAMQAVLDHGGNIGNSVTKKTNYLVIGMQDYREIGSHMSSKAKKAQEYRDNGQDIRIISEEEFIAMLEPQKSIGHWRYKHE